MIPKTLAVNAAKDSTDLVAKLRAYHNAAQSAPVGDPRRGLRHYGLDLSKGEVRDNVKAGVLEPMVSKVKSLKSALEACTALLRIDDRVRFAFCFHFFLSVSLPRLPFRLPSQANEEHAKLTRSPGADHGSARAKGRRWLARALEDGGGKQSKLVNTGSIPDSSQLFLRLVFVLASFCKNNLSSSSSGGPRNGTSFLLHSSVLESRAGSLFKARKTSQAEARSRSLLSCKSLARTENGSGPRPSYSQPRPGRI